MPGQIQSVKEDLYRFGNAQSPRLDYVREETDVQTYVHKGIKFVRANGEGISLLSEDRAAKLSRGGWLWKFPAMTLLPRGLFLNNDRPGHFALCPAFDMNIEDYRSLLLGLEAHCERITKL